MKKISWILTCTLIICLSGCSSKNVAEKQTSILTEKANDIENENNTIESSTIESSTTESTTKEQNEKEKERIIKFYDTIYELYDKTKNGTTESIEKIVDESRQVCDDMELLASESTEYSSYAKKVTNNSIYKIYKRDYLNGNDLKEKDDSFVRSTYIMMLESIYETLITIELPFEYDKYQNIKSKTEKNMSVKSELDAYYQQMKEKNIPVMAFGDYYAYPEDKRSVGKVGKYEMEIFPEVDYKAESLYAFGFTWIIYGMDESVEKIEIQTKDSTLVVSGKDTSIYSLDDETVGFFYLYGSDLTETDNKRYEQFKKILDENDSLNVVFNGKIKVKYEKIDLDYFKEYVALFEILLSLANN